MCGGADMTTTNGWAGKPGVPLNPEEPRYHWVKGCDGEDTIVFWRGHGGDTHYENGDLKELDHWSGYPMWIAQEWVYLGPVLTPDEAAALQKRCEEAERTAIQAAECHAREMSRADALQKRVTKLEGALREMVYEATHLSPQNIDGSHWCKISKRTLDKARAALEGKKDE